MNLFSISGSIVSALLLFFLCQSIGWVWVENHFANWSDRPRFRACVLLMAAFGIGLWIIAVTVMLWGMTVGLSVEKILILWVALVIGGRSSFAPLLGAYRDACRGLRLCGREKMGVAVLMAITGWGLVFALVPPLMTDTVRYHLGVPSVWWNLGAIEKLPHFSEQHLVMMWQHASLLLLGLDQAVGAKVFCFLGFPLTLLAAGIFVNQRCGRAAAFFSCLMLAATPTFFENGVLGTVDTGLAFFTAMALLFWFQDEPKWIWAGVMVGLAFCTKWQGLVLLPALVATGLASRWPGFLRSAAWMILFAALLFVPWGLRNLFWSHDPVYPFLAQFFSPEAASVTGRFDRLMSTYGLSGQPWWQYLLYPLHLTFADCAFWFGGKIVFESRIGWMYLLMLPFSLLALRTERGVRPLLTFTAVVFVLGLFMGELPRFLLPAWVAYAVACGGVWKGNECRMRCALSAALGLVSIWNLWDMTGVLNQKGFAPLAYYREGEPFYARIQPEWRAAEWTHSHYPGSKVLLVGLDGNLYWKNPMVVDGPFDDKTLVELAKLPGGTEAMVAHLKASGIGVIVINSDRAEKLEKQFGYMGWDTASRKNVREFFRDRVVAVYRDGAIQVGTVR